MHESSAPAAAAAWDWPRIRAEFPIVDRTVPLLDGREVKLVYLDHAASTHAPVCVLDRYMRFMSNEYANIHRGTHLLSRKATEAFDDCYTTVANLIGGNLDRDCVVFTSNTTHAIDLAAHVMRDAPGEVITTGLEHHSNELPHRARGPVHRVRATADGQLDMEHLAQLLASRKIKLVAVAGATNVTGWMPDLHAIAKLAHAAGAKILVDAAQLLAHQRIDVRDPDDDGHLDFVAAAGHKAYAPFGAGFLYGPRELFDAAPAFMAGGGTAAEVTEDGVRWVDAPDRHQGGTPNIAGVIAMAEAIKMLSAIGMDRIREHELSLTRRAVAALQELSGVTLYGPQDVERRLGVLPFNVDGVSDLLTAAVLSEEAGLACRNGRFCAHLHMGHLLRHQGGGVAEDGAVPGAVRASFGLYNDESDVDRLIAGVELVRDRGWKGTYGVRSGSPGPDPAGRCNDSWMEPT